MEQRSYQETNSWRLFHLIIHPIGLKSISNKNGQKKIYVISMLTAISSDKPTCQWNNAHVQYIWSTACINKNGILSIEMSEEKNETAES